MSDETNKPDENTKPDESAKPDEQARAAGQAPDQPAKPEQAETPAAKSPGVEREDAGAGVDQEQAQDEVAVVDESRSTEPTPYGQSRGMWGPQPGDTSGYGGIEREWLPPTTASRPYGGWFDEVVDRMAELVPGAIDRVSTEFGELTCYIHREHIAELARALRDDAYLRFEMLSGVSGVHYPHDTDGELHAVYHLQSFTHNRRLRLEVRVPDADPHVDSVVATYPMADWHERETWDMFGLVFDGHPGLTRILMPDDWVGHPQRKDYPLGGIDVEYKGAVIPPPDQRRRY